jgi:hypothetical protein
LTPNGLASVFSGAFATNLHKIQANIGAKNGKKAGVYAKKWLITNMEAPEENYSGVV